MKKETSKILKRILNKGRGKKSRANSLLKKRLQALGVIALFLLAITLIFLPYLKNAVITYRVSNTTLTMVTELPKELPKEETIRPPEIRDVFAKAKKDATGVGRIIIPTVKINLPITAGVTNYNLTFSTAAMFPERKLSKDNVVIIGHNLGMYDLFFGKLLDVKKNAKIYVKYLDEVEEYTVTRTFVVKEESVAIADNTEEPLLTLITCPTSYQTDERFVVEATPVAREKAVVPKEIQESLTEQTVRTEISSWRSSKLTVLYMICGIVGSIMIYLMIVKGKFSFKRRGKKD